MRTFGLPTKIAVAIAAAAGLVVALGMPWYGHAPATAAPSGAATLSGSLGDAAAAVRRWFTAGDGTAGWDLAGRWPMAMAGAAVLAAFAAVLCLAPSTEDGGRALLRLCALACAAGAVLKLWLRPDGWEPRYGLLLAVGASATLLLMSRGILASALRRRRGPARPGYISPGFAPPKR